MGENHLRCTMVHLGQTRPNPYCNNFFLIFLSPSKLMNHKVSSIYKYHILDHYNFRLYHNHP